MGIPNAHNSIQPILPSWFFSIFIVPPKMFERFRNANRRPAGKTTLLSDSWEQMSQYRDESEIDAHLDFQEWDSGRMSEI